MRLRVLVHAAGFGGQGHVEALRVAGATVVGMVSRTKDMIEQVARKMAIPYARTECQSVPAALKPDILAVGTPGGTILNR